ncbi:TonB-dependent receptor plug domain-containing protein [Altererythrobacter sp.]|uniref:TonB-dependent receptor plug domain-containing protein n=1 Tax=Altererythrobacter sp. TaxID=1872480 RepID=UPI003CFD4114
MIRARIARPQKARLPFIAGTSILALTVAVTPVAAQEAPSSGETVEQPAAGSIVVTGSRLRTDGMQTPIPVTSVDAEALEDMAAGNLIEGVGQLPQFFGNQSVSAVQKSGEGGTGWFTRGGYGNLDLRGLGINRTLTLLNGRRMISSGVFGGVDINVFPEGMIKNVETTTGGASAAYGTDAVAGVVNFTLDTDFTGVQAKVQGGITDRGDSASYEASLSFGTSIGERGHLLLSGEIFDQNGVHNYKDRNWYDAWGVIGSDAYPQVISANSSYNGVIFAPGTPLQGMEFLPDGSGITPFVLGAPSLGTIGTPPARHSVANGGSGDDLGGELFTLFPDAKRNSLFAYADYEVSDGLTLFAQAVRGQNKTFRYNDPTGSFNGTPTTATIFQDNAFLPDSVRQTMIDNNIDSFVLRRMGSTSDLAREIWLRDNNVMYSFTGGLSWDIASGGMLDGWHVDAYYQYGTNTRKAYQSGIRVDRIFAALDAVRDPSSGEIVCRTSLFGNAFPGCEPINLFGAGNASAAAIDYVTGFEAGEQVTTPIFYADSGFDRGETYSYTTGNSKLNTTRMRQHLVDFSMSGDVLEGWAGPITMALGASYRKDSVRQLVQDVTNPASDHTNGHPVLCSGEAPGLRGVSVSDCLNTVGVQYSKVSNIRGSINVKEAFAEALVPLLANAGPVNALNLHLAGRWADYSGSGTVWAYKAGLDAEIADFLRLRGTYSRDVRAANLSERFDKTGGVAVLDDPRTPNVVEALNVTRFSGGNPAVNPEKADTWTVGAVLRPSFLPGFSVSADYYDIKIKGAIGQLGSQAVLNGCLIDNVPELCDLVTLDPGDVPILVGDVFINVNENRVRGLDVEMAYSTPVALFGGDEELSTRVFASWLFENSQTLGNGTYTDRAGQTGIQQSDGAPYGLPDFKATGNITYSNGGFGAYLQGRYISSGQQENSLGDVPLNKVDSAFYLDLKLSQEIEVGSSTFEIFASVTNLLDEDPPITPYYSVFGGHSAQTNSVLFDLLGRRYNVGVKFRM